MWSMKICSKEAFVKFSNLSVITYKFVVLTLGFICKCIILWSDTERELRFQQCFQKYLLAGGMPYLANLCYADAPSRQYLHDLFNSVQLKDIVKRNKIWEVDLTINREFGAYDNIRDFLLAEEWN